MAVLSLSDVIGFNESEECLGTRPKSCLRRVLRHVYICTKVVPELGPDLHPKVSIELVHPHSLYVSVLKPFSGVLQVPILYIGPKNIKIIV